MVGVNTIILICCVILLVGVVAYIFISMTRANKKVSEMQVQIESMKALQLGDIDVCQVVKREFEVPVFKKVMENECVLLELSKRVSFLRDQIADLEFRVEFERERKEEAGDEKVDEKKENHEVKVEEVKEEKETKTPFTSFLSALPETIEDICFFYEKEPPINPNIQIEEVFDEVKDSKDPESGGDKAGLGAVH